MLTFAQKRALLRASVVLSLVGLGLKVLPFSVFRRWFYRLTGSARPLDTPQAELEVMAGAVRTAAHRLPFRLLCLPQALAVKYLLRHEAGLSLHIGVQNDPVQGFMAHAWVEKKGHILIGEYPEAAFQSIWIWE